MIEENKVITEPIKEVLIIHTWGLGDMLLLTPVLNAVHYLHPEVRFTFLIFQPISAIPLKDAEYVKAIHFGGWNLSHLLYSLRILGKTRFDAAMFSSGVKPWKAALFMLRLKTGIRIGEYWSYKFPSQSKHVHFDPSISRTESNYHLLSSFLELPDWNTLLLRKDEVNLKPSFNLEKESIEYAKKYYNIHHLKDKMLIGIHPGCMAKNKYRRWPKEYFLKMINMLKSKYDCKILIIAGPDELDVGEYLHEQTGELLLKNESLMHVAAIISRLSFFINTDSGLGHIASCFNIKSLTIFGPGDERQTAPFSDNSSIIRYEIDCAPCVNKKKKPCNLDCVRKLTPEMVIEKAEVLLGEQI